MRDAATVTVQEVYSARLIRLINDRDGDVTPPDVVALAEMDPAKVGRHLEVVPDVDSTNPTPVEPKIPTPTPAEETGQQDLSEIKKALAQAFGVDADDLPSALVAGLLTMIPYDDETTQSAPDLLFPVTYSPPIVEFRKLDSRLQDVEDDSSTEQDAADLVRSIRKSNSKSAHYILNQVLKSSIQIHNARGSLIHQLAMGAGKTAAASSSEYLRGEGAPLSETDAAQEPPLYYMPQFTPEFLVDVPTDVLEEALRLRTEAASDRKK